jgi:hypothetical protein
MRCHTESIRRFAPGLVRLGRMRFALGAGRPPEWSFSTCSMIPTVYLGERYKCPACNISLEESSLTERWKCVTCEGAVTIYAEDGEGRRRTINRLAPSEVRVGFLVVVPTSGMKHVHEVLDVTREAGGYRIALKEYTVLRYSDDDLLNCVTGTW